MLHGNQISAAERECLVFRKIPGAVLLRELYQPVGGQRELAALVFRQRSVIRGRTLDPGKRLLNSGGGVFLHDLLDEGNVVGERLLARLRRLLDYCCKQRRLGVHHRFSKILAEGLSGHQQFGAYIRESHQSLLLRLVGVQPVDSTGEKHIFVEQLLEYHQRRYFLLTYLHCLFLLVLSLFFL